jgi:hypothetical protein
MFMAKKKTSKKKTVKKEEPVEPIGEIEEPVEKKTCGSFAKYAIIGLLFIIIAALVYYYSLVPQDVFVPGPSVDEETFLQIYENTSNIFIISDIRGYENTSIGVNIMQCGVDFASSTIMGSKNVTYYSLGEEGCSTTDGFKTVKYCFSQAYQGLTFYIHEGTEYGYYNNAMMVGISENYSSVTCGIKTTYLVN